MKVKLELKSLTISGLIELTKTIIKSLTGNSNFTTPSPALALITTAQTNVSNALSDVEAARKAAQQKTAVLNQQRDILEGLLTQLGAYVENVANGDEAKIRSAGMNVRNDNTPVGIPGKIESVSVSLGDNAGEIDLHWDRIQGAKSYIIETAVNGTSSDLVWTHAAVVTKSKAEINHACKRHEVSS